MTSDSEPPIPDHAFNYPKLGNIHELKHYYGNNIHVMNDRLLLLMLAHMGKPDTEQNTARELVRHAYQLMFTYVARREFQWTTIKVPTRMQPLVGEQGFYQGPVADLGNVVVVSIERAGALPTDSIVDLITLVTDGSVRRDSITADRTTDAEGHVTGCHISGAKIGGSVNGAYVLIPDVMAATGSTLDAVVDIYHGKQPVPGTTDHVMNGARKIIAMHLIAAPEYLQFMKKNHPDVILYIGRVDRGLSDPKVLKSVLGSNKEGERGLTDKSYIVPGAGGMGEMLSGEVQRKPFYAR